MLAGPSSFQAYSREAQVYFSCDVDSIVKSLAVGFKNMQSLQMSALLNDVDGALQEEASANINFRSSDAAKGDTGEAEAHDTETNMYSIVDEDQNTDGRCCS
jgi:hypothetical protein